MKRVRFVSEIDTLIRYNMPYGIIMQPAKKSRSSTHKFRGQGAKSTIDQELIDDQKFQESCVSPMVP
jgi:hypothetical protein